MSDFIFQRKTTESSGKNWRAATNSGKEQNTQRREKEGCPMTGKRARPHLPRKLSQRLKIVFACSLINSRLKFVEKILRKKQLIR